MATADINNVEITNLPQGLCETEDEVDVELSRNVIEEDHHRLASDAIEESKKDDTITIEKPISTDIHQEDIKFIQAGSQFQVINGTNLNEICIRRCWLSPFNDKVYFSVDGTKQLKLTVDVMEIEEIRPGWRSDDFLRAVRFITHEEIEFGYDEPHRIKLMESHCFSIHFGQRSLSLQADEAETAFRWVNALQFLIDRAHFEARRNRNDPTYWLRRFFREATSNDPSAGLTYEQCERLYSDMNVKTEAGRLRACFKTANTDLREYNGEQVLNEEEFVSFFHMVSHRPILDNIFKDLCGEDLHLSVEKLNDFLINVQGLNDVTMEQTKQIIETYGAHELLGFRSLMTSELFDIRKEEHRKVHQDMTQPLSHYWIRSSLKTYLNENRSGSSSIEGYVRAQDYASVELDLRDGPDDQAVVSSSGISARDVLEYAIRPYAFMKDDYPLILSIDDHLSGKQRKRFINDLEHVFGHNLCKIDVNDLTQLPSPEELKRKIILHVNQSEYGRLANVCQNVPFDFPSPVIPCSISSLSDCQIHGIISQSFWEYLTFKAEPPREREESLKRRITSQLIRVYPKWSDGFLLFQNKFNPLYYMNLGCQMVAMDAQTACKELALYAGRFRTNGDSAYVLKPAFLIDPLAQKVSPKRLLITVVSAQQLPRVKDSRPMRIYLDYVTVTIEGVTADQQEKRTEKVYGHGLNPVWEEKMTFKVTEPELALVMFSVKHCGAGSSTLLGSFALPVLSLGLGYRHVPLHDHRLSPVPLATLFVKIDLQDLLSDEN